MDKGAAKAERGTPAPRGVRLFRRHGNPARVHMDAYVTTYLIL